MLVSELFDRVLVESGQFLISEENIEMHHDRFVLLVRATLGTYNKYFPYIKKENVSTCGSRPVITFSDDNEFGVPDWISEVIPIRTIGASTRSLFGGHNSIIRAGAYGWPNQSNQYLEVKSPFPWEYRKPKLHVPIDGKYDITAVFYHRLTEVPDTGDSNTPVQYEIQTISQESGSFISLLTGKFLIGIGKNRRAFTMQDLPIVSDSESMVSEGQELVAQTIENLHENHNRFYLGWT